MIRLRRPRPLSRGAFCLLLVAGAGALAASAGCSGGGAGATGMGGHPGMGTPGMGGTGPAGPGSGGMGMGMGMGPGSGASTGAAGAGTTCGSTQQTVVVDCGYPYSSSTVLTSVTFNEDGVLRTIVPSTSGSSGVVRMFYNDEHAMTLGVRSVVVTSASGSATTNYSVSALSADPGSVQNPQLGTTMLIGDQSGLDQSLRPMWPVLYVTDVSVDPTSKVGDWQQGGRPIGPNAVYGTWKAAVRTVDDTASPPTVTITPDADPAKNGWTLGGPDAAPSGLSNEGYGAEVVWSVPFTPGHSYRVQVLVHDGDQNKAGGDAGEACVLFCAGGGDCESNGTCGATGGSSGSTGSGGSSGSGGCPEGTTACGGGGPDGVTCGSGMVCANGCCLPGISIS